MKLFKNLAIPFYILIIVMNLTFVIIDILGFDIDLHDYILIAVSVFCVFRIFKIRKRMRDYNADTGLSKTS